MVFKTPAQADSSQQMTKDLLHRYRGGRVEPRWAIRQTRPWGSHSALAIAGIAGGGGDQLMAIMAQMLGELDIQSPSDQ